MIGYIAIYVLCGFISMSLLHRYWEEMEENQFVVFVFLFPCILFFVFIAIAAKCFKNYLSWIKKRSK